MALERTLGDAADARKPDVTNEKFLFVFDKRKTRLSTFSNKVQNEAYIRRNVRARRRCLHQQTSRQCFFSVCDSGHQYRLLYIQNANDTSYRCWHNPFCRSPLQGQFLKLDNGIWRDIYWNRGSHCQNMPGTSRQYTSKTRIQQERHRRNSEMLVALCLHWNLYRIDVINTYDWRLRIFFHKFCRKIDRRSDALRHRVKNIFNVLQCLVNLSSHLSRLIA